MSSMVWDLDVGMRTTWSRDSLAGWLLSEGLACSVQQLSDAGVIQHVGDEMYEAPGNLAIDDLVLVLDSEARLLAESRNFEEDILESNCYWGDDWYEPSKLFRDLEESELDAEVWFGFERMEKFKG